MHPLARFFLVVNVAIFPAAALQSLFNDTSDSAFAPLWFGSIVVVWIGSHVLWPNTPATNFTEPPASRQSSHSDTESSIEDDLASIGLGRDRLVQMNSAELVTASETAYRSAAHLGHVVADLQRRRIGFELDCADRLDDAAAELFAKSPGDAQTADNVRSVAEMFRTAHTLIASDREQASSMLKLAETAFEVIAHGSPLSTSERQYRNTASW